MWDIIINAIVKIYIFSIKYLEENCYAGYTQDCTNYVYEKKGDKYGCRPESNYTILSCKSTTINGGAIVTSISVICSIFGVWFY